MGRWFGRKSAVPDTRAFVPAWLQSNATGEGFARSYSAQFEEVYRRNPVGQRAVRLVAGMLGGLTVEGDERAVALVRADGLLEAIAANLLLHGNAYVRLIADDEDAPAELVQLRPERVGVISDETGWPTGYLYRAGGQAARIARCDALGRRQVAHVKALHPRDDHYGMGSIEAAIGAASVHNRASLWNKALLDNAARPSGALSYEPGDGSVLTGEQFERLKAELTSEFSGSGNAGRPLVLEGGLKWQALSLTPADMDFVALKEGAARDIALAFGVPPVLVGLPGDATYANAREAGRALYRQTILPLAGRVLGALSAMLGDWLGPVALTVDEDQLSERAEDRTLLWAQVNAAGFLSDAEKREMLGFSTPHPAPAAPESPSPSRGRGAMSADALLASLMAQAEGRGVDLVTLRALVEESCQAGARRALASLGLDDERARRDMDELRELLAAWRDAKRSAWRAVVTWVTRLGLALLLIGIAVRLRLTDLVR
jgi:HK97 family phage portal protein